MGLKQLRVKFRRVQGFESHLKQVFGLTYYFFLDKLELIVVGVYLVVLAKSTEVEDTYIIFV